MVRSVEFQKWDVDVGPESGAIVELSNGSKGTPVDLSFVLSRLQLQSPQRLGEGRLTLTGALWARPCQVVPGAQPGWVLYPQAGGLFQIILPVQDAQGQLAYLISAEARAEQEAVDQLRRRLGVADDRSRLESYSPNPEELARCVRSLQSGGSVELGGPSACVDVDSLVRQYWGFPPAARACPSSIAMVLSRTRDPNVLFLRPAMGGMTQVLKKTPQGVSASPWVQTLPEALKFAGIPEQAIFEV